MRVRKKHPGSSSHGHEWTEAGQILDIPVEDAADCMRVAPDEFEVLADETPAPQDPTEDPDSKKHEGDTEGPEKAPVTEPDPDPETEPETKRPTRGRGRRVTED